MPDIKQYIVIRVDAPNSNEVWAVNVSQAEFQECIAPLINEGYSEFPLTDAETIVMVTEVLDEIEVEDSI